MSTPAFFNKPPAGTKLNYTHPLSQGCVGAWLLNEGDGNVINDAAGYNDGDLSAIGALAWATNEYGPCLRIADVSQYAILARCDRLFRKNTGETQNNFTIVHCFKKASGVFTNGWSFGIRATNSEIAKTFAAQTPNSGGDIIWLVGGSDADVNIQTALFGTYPTVDMDIWVFTNSFSKGMEIWKNGHRISYGLTKNPTIQISVNTLVLGDPVSDSGSGFNGAELGDHTFLYAYDRCLTPTEIISISNKPYQMFDNKIVPLNLLVGDLGIINERGRGGAVLNGRAGLADLVSAQGGAVLGGNSTAAFIPTPYIPTGGIEAAGDAFVLRTKVEIGSGGAEAGGAALPGLSVVGKGGSVVGGSAPMIVYDIIEETLDGEGVLLGGVGSRQFFYNPIITSNGAELAGVAKVIDIIAARGGAELAGVGFLAPGGTSATGSGGAVLGGETQVNWFITERILSFAVEVGGRAINIRRGTIQNLHVGYAQAMKNDNIIKSNLAASLEPVKIMIPEGLLTPEEPESKFRIEQMAQWCYIEDCDDNVLPRIVEKRQGKYIPPRKRNDQQRNRQIARATGL